MGHEIVYCVQCASRIAGTDFEKGKAFRAGGKNVCAACYPSLLATLSPEEQASVHSAGSSAKHRKVAVPSGGSSTRLRRAEPTEEKSRGPMIAAAAGGGLLLLGAILFAALRSGPPAPPPEPTPPVAPPPKVVVAPEPPKEDAPTREAREAIEAARAKSKTAPDDLDGQIAAWEEASRKSALTGFFKEATATLGGLRERKAALKPPPPKDQPAAVVPPVEPAVKPPSPDLKAYQFRWEAAAAKATARDFEGAIADLGRAAAELTDDGVRQEARADAELLQRIRTLRADAVAAVSALQRGRELAVHVRTDGGERKRVAGVVLRAGNGRVELRAAEETVFIEAEDLPAHSLASLTGFGSPAERRAFAALCMLEGDAEGSAALAGPDALPERYRDYSRDAASKVPRPSPRELEARRRFYAAEREFARTDSLPAAVAKYKSLAEDYADTALVKGEAPRIRKRSEAGREYIFVAGGLKGTGTFALSPAPRTEVAWVSKANVEGNRETLENFVEVEFAALPETAYRCWALVGGCCAETLAFYLQTTEAMEPHPRTKQKTSIDPGAELAAFVKHSISGLKKTHEEHKIKGAKTHPKTAARWEWVTIPLPKYAGAGAKKVRLISDQQGFGVGAIVVSSTRASVLPDAELKEEVARVRSQVAAAQEGLAGWWRLDEGAGAGANDAVEGGRAGVFTGSPKWAAGKVGGALKFADGDQVRIPGTYAFAAITLSAWVKHDALGAPRQRYITVGDEACVLRCEGNGVHFYLRTDGDLRQIHVPGSLEAGKWIHVAGTWDGTTMKAYKDGQLIGSATPGGKLGPGGQVLLGSASESMQGLIDEARIYSRALSDAEIQRLVAEGTAGTIAELGVAPPPPPEKPWRALFDGKSTSCLKHGGWKFENGAIEYIVGSDDAAQTREIIEDGELRIRFEVKDAEKVWFNLRQGGGGEGYRVAFENDIKALEGKPHDLVFTAKGDQVTATLDGKPVPVGAGSARSGCLQFNARGKTIRILSLDVR